MDLGAVRPVGRVVLRWEAAHGRAYQIQTSTDGSRWSTAATVDSGDGGVDDLGGLTTSGRYVRLYGTARATGWGYSLWGFEVYEQSAANIALGCPANASSVEAPGFQAPYAVDGNLSTAWSSAYTDPQWIEVDLGSTRTIRRVVLRWEAAYASRYRVEVSPDGAQWYPLTTVTNGDGGVDDLTGLSGAGRYLRVYGTARGTGWGYSLWELEAYES